MMPSSGPWAERLVRALMLLYPRAFRREHGDGVRQTYRDVLRDAKADGGSPLRTWLWLLRDALVCAVRIRVSRSDESQSRDELGNGGGEVMKAVWGEMKLAVRTLARAPGFALVVVLTMGLGIGANTAIFSVVHSVLLQPLPYDDGDELVWLMNRYLPDGTLGAISAGEFWEYRRNQPALDGLAAVSGLTANLTGLQTPVQLRGLSVSPGYFAVLGTGPVLGRAFVEEEEQPGGAPVTVISHGLWQTAFGSDPDILGRQILLNGASVPVVGVMGPEHAPLRGLLSPGSRTDYWVPMILDPTTFTSETVERHGLSVVGRLADSADREMAEVGLLEAVHRVEANYPGISYEGSREVAVMTLRERIVGDVTGALFLLSSAVALVLALACMNVTNLLIARGETRRAEIAVRAALGAGRSRLMLHMIAESTIIGLVGGVVGLGLAIGGRNLVFALDPQAAMMGEGVGFGLPVLAFSLGLSILAGALAGAIPGARVARGDLATTLKAGAQRGSTGSHRQILKRALVVGQVAGAVMLVAGAALLVRTLSQLRSVDPGFESSGLQIVRVNASRRMYQTLEQVQTLYETLESELVALPGVHATTASWQTPLQSGMSDWPVSPETTGESNWIGADPNYVSLSYFDTYRIPLVEGRYFDRSDMDRAAGPVVLNETAARLLWPDEDAVGKRVNLDFGEAIWREVVGVVADIKGRGLGQESRPQTYLTFAPGPFSSVSLTLTVRSALGTEELRLALINVMGRIDPDIPIGPVVAMDQQVENTLRVERLLSALLSVFGVMALLLGSIGVYGLMAYNVQRRRREIGLRLAIGAGPSGVLGLVVREGMVLGAVGVVLGLGGAVAMGRLLQSFLYGVSQTDTVTLAVVAVTVFAVTGLASFGPARRAAMLDPLTTLREE